MQERKCLERKLMNVVCIYVYWIGIWMWVGMCGRTVEQQTNRAGTHTGSEWTSYSPPSHEEVSAGNDSSMAFMFIHVINYSVSAPFITWASGNAFTVFYSCFRWFSHIVVFIILNSIDIQDLHSACRRIITWFSHVSLCLETINIQFGEKFAPESFYHQETLPSFDCVDGRSFQNVS